MEINIVIGDFKITPSYANDPDKIGIQHESGEGGDFNRKEFEDHMYRAVSEFYKEHF